MLRVNQRVTINGRTLPFVGRIEIVTSRNNFTDTAVIQLPNRIPERGERISTLIEKGSPVSIELGYFPALNLEYTGYVSQVIPEKTVIIQCEDEAYNVKRQSVGRDIILKKTTIRQLIETIYTGDSLINDGNIGDWKISKTSTVIDVLKELQSKFKIYSYFRGTTLVVGAQADTRVSQNIPCRFQENVPIGESDFNFKEANADRIVVKATNITRSGVINEVYAFYDGNPAAITFSRVAPTSGTINEFNIGGQSDLTIEDLQELAQIRLEALSFTGVDGSITIYGSPSVSHGDIAVVQDLDVPEKDGNYAIVEVRKRFGIGIGFRQDLGLGISI